MKKKLILGALALAIIGFQSCKKAGSSDTSTTSLATSLKAASAEVVSTTATTASSADVQSVSVEKFDGTTSAIAYDAISNGGDLFSKGSVHFGIPHIDSCATVTVSSSTYPKEITIDYGTGCTDRKGHVISGKIIIEISDTISVAGATETITYQDFYIDTVQIVYSASLKNLGQNDSGHWVIEKKLDKTVTKNDDVIVVSSTESDEWIAGFTTTSKSDDIYYESGSGTITVNDTSTFIRNITSPLLVDRTCGYITSGTVELTRNGTTVIIDYGDGTCDNVATVTVDGVTEEIELHGGGYKDGGEFKKHCDGFGKKHSKH